MELWLSLCGDGRLSCQINYSNHPADLCRAPPTRDISPKTSERPSAVPGRRIISGDDAPVGEAFSSERTVEALVCI